MSDLVEWLNACYDRADAWAEGLPAEGETVRLLAEEFASEPGYDERWRL